MAMVFLRVNPATNAVTYAGSGQPTWMVDHGSFNVIYEDYIQVIKGLLSDTSSHTYLEVVGSSPYITSLYNGNQVVVNLFNQSTTPPNSATISILGQTFTANITNNQVVFPITVHPAIANQRLTVAVMVDGSATVYVEVGGSGSSIEVTLYKDSSGVIQIVPAKNADLASYWQSKTFNPVWTQSDISTYLGILAVLVVNKILPSLQSASYTPVVLSADEQNAVNDLVSSILPNIPSQLDTLAPIPASGQPQSFDVHYSSLRAHIQTAKTAMDNYVQDRDNITKYITLQ